MSIKDVLVQVDAGRATASRLDLAVDLARKHGAHLTGLFVFDIQLVPGAGMGTLNPEDAMGLIRWQAQLRDEAEALAANLSETFNECIRRNGIEGEWRTVEGNAADTVSLHARYADLVILGQEDPDDTRLSSWSHVVENALLTAGRPILVVPYVGRFPTLGKRALIGWNARREAARAVHDALPLLHGATSVTILAIDARQDHAHGEEPAADIARHLARHGLPVTAKQTSADDLGAADILLNYAADNGCDLIVIGGYGHSRVRELVLGGTTRALLRQSPVPVLMSH